MSHRTRALLASRYPVHVTLRLEKGLPTLRRRREHAVLLEAFTIASSRESFRVVHYSAQSNHLHLLCEARDRRELSRGINGLAVRVARGLNKLWRRRGRLFADRYHDHILRTPREVRNALAYLLNNARRHGIHWRSDRPDQFSSGRWFAGWRESLAILESPLARASTWLLTVGWRRHGPIGLGEVPG